MGATGFEAQPRRGRHRLLVSTGFFAALLLLIWGFLNAGVLLKVNDPLEAADAVVALAGDQDRIPHAIRIFAEGYAEWFGITGLPLARESFRQYHLDRMREMAVVGGVPDAAIVIVPGVARTTFEEVENLLASARAEDWERLILVTSPWHTLRARLVARSIFAGSGVRVAVQASQEHDFDLQRWWSNPTGRQIVISEYLKLGAFFVGIR